MTIKYCVNCEEPIMYLIAGELTDFCSQECADEYLSSADERVLLLARELNPDALPIAELTRAAQPSRSNTGILPSTLEAVQSLLNIGGVSQEAIDNVMNTDKVVNIDRVTDKNANNKELTQKEQEFVKNEPKD